MQSLRYKHEELPNLNKQKLLLGKAGTDALTLNYF